MDRQQIIDEVRQMDRDQLEKVRKFLDQLVILPESQKDAKALDLEVPESEK